MKNEKIRTTSTPQNEKKNDFFYLEMASCPIDTGLNC